MKLKLLLTLLVFNCYAQIPSYYNGIDLASSSENLKAQLAQLITTTHTTELVYTSGSSGLLDTWTVLKQSDLDMDDASRVLLVYGWNDLSAMLSEQRSRDVEESCHTSSCTGKWVREHVFPRSIGTPNLGAEGAGSDAHNLRAIDAQRNNARSNRLFADAVSSTASHTIGTDAWYPGDEWIGDVSRIIMYMYLRYPTQCAPLNVATGVSTFAPLLDMPDILLQWNAQDPPSDFELNRNNVIANHQGNRNPFIDNPYLATMLWNGPQAQNNWNELHVDHNILDKMYIYPTVTSSRVYIQNTTELDYRYSLYSSTGQLLQDNRMDKDIDLSAYSKGLYLIQINGKDKPLTFKVIKN